jgi:hypothetical protein
MFVLDNNHKDATKEYFDGTDAKGNVVKIRRLDKSEPNLVPTKVLQKAYETWIERVKRLIHRQEAKAPDQRLNLCLEDMLNFRKWMDEFCAVVNKKGAAVGWDKFADCFKWRPTYMLQLEYNDPRWNSKAS